MTPIARIELPKPHSEELRKAQRRKRRWLERREICNAKLREIQKQIELLEFQMDLGSLESCSLPARRIEAGSGLDWGIFWKDALVSLLPLHNAKGIGKKRLRHVLAAFKTVGDLEGWRIVHGFRTLPGFTKSAAASLEEVLIRWLRRFAPDYTIRASADSLPRQKAERPKDGILWLDD